MDLKAYAYWTHDCQGKQDFDGPLLSVSTRYWPGPEGGGFMMVNNGPGGAQISTKPYGKQPSAHSSIILRLGPKEPNDGGGEYLVWREKEFSAPTEAEVKAEVEAWAAEQMVAVVALLGGIAQFKKP
jgi:hypothetical protein